MQSNVGWRGLFCDDAYLSRGLFVNYDAFYVCACDVKGLISVNAHSSGLWEEYADILNIHLKVIYYWINEMNIFIWDRYYTTWIWSNKAIFTIV